MVAHASTGQAALADLINQKSTPLGLLGARLARQPATTRDNRGKACKATSHTKLTLSKMVSKAQHTTSYTSLASGCRSSAATRKHSYSPVNVGPYRNNTFRPSSAMELRACVCVASQALLYKFLCVHAFVCKSTCSGCLAANWSSRHA